MPPIPPVSTGLAANYFPIIIFDLCLLVFNSEYLAQLQ